MDTFSACRRFTFCRSVSTSLSCSAVSFSSARAHGAWIDYGGTTTGKHGHTLAHTWPHASARARAAHTHTMSALARATMASSTCF